MIHVFIRGLALVLLLAGTSQALAAASSPAPTPLQQLFVLKEIMPDVQQVGVIWTKESPNHDALMKALNQASSATDINVVVSYVEDVSDVASSFRKLQRSHGVDVVWVLEEEGALGQELSRSYLIKNTLKFDLPLLAPSNVWISDGAPVSMQTLDDKLHLVANKAACDAMSVTIPEKYHQQTQYLTLN